MPRSQEVNAEIRAQLHIDRRTHDENEHTATRATLELRDNISGLVFAQVFLTAQDLADLLTGSETGTVEDDPNARHGSRLVGTPGWITPQEDRQNIGRMHFHVSFPVGRSADLGEKEALERWASRVRHETDSASASLSKRNDGNTYLTLRAYRETQGAGERWQAIARVAEDSVRLAPRKGEK
jgi:hypothetical protein